MTISNPVRAGIIGCGNIAPRYITTMRSYSELEIAGITSRRSDVCAAFAIDQGLRAYVSVDELLADDTIELVVDLTVQDAHPEVVTQCLNAGKHVYAEKPLAFEYSRARELAELANKKRLRLGCAPCTFMSEGVQTAWKVLREGRLGKVRVVYAEMNHARPDLWHPSPAPFLNAGPLFDVGVYSITVLATILGPAASVQAYAHRLLPERKLLDGSTLHLESPDFIVAMIEFRSGALARVTTNYYVDWAKKQSGIEFHGDDASLYLSNAMIFNGVVEFAPFGKGYEPVEHVRQAFRGMDFARGIADLASAIRGGRPHRATAENAAHVIEIIAGAHESIASGRPVAIKSDFVPSAPMDWAVD